MIAEYIFYAIIALAVIGTVVKVFRRDSSGSRFGPPGGTPGTPGTGGPAAGSTPTAMPATPGSYVRSVKDWLTERTSAHWFTSVCIVLIVALAAFGGLVPPARWFKQAPAMAEVSMWSWDRWIVLPIFFGLVVAIIYLLAEAKLAKTLQWIPILMLGFLLFVTPGVAWFKAPSQSTSVATNTVPLANKPVAQWPTIVTEPRGRSMVLRVFGNMRPIIGGNGRVVYCVFLDGHEASVSGDRCPREGVAQIYALNTLNTKNYLPYAYEE